MSKETLQVRKMEEQMETTDLREEAKEWPTTQSKYVGFRNAAVAKQMISFWFSIGTIIAVEAVDSLYHFVRALTSGCH